MTLASRFMAARMKLPAAETTDVVVERDLGVESSDGAVLLADRYAPRGVVKPPLVLVRSPYGRRGVFGLVYGRMFAERGFQAVVQSCRGTFGSGGVFDPFGNVERDDGLATVAWMRDQPWYPGSFGTMGASYLGLTQWAIAGVVGPEHRAMAAHVTASDFRPSIYKGGSFSLQDLLGWIQMLSVQEGRWAFLRQIGAQRRRRPLFQRLPLRDLDRLATGATVASFQQWLDHSDPKVEDDPFWKDHHVSEPSGTVETPTILICGWDDIFLPAQVRDYEELRAAGRAPHLTIGPWSHAQPSGLAVGIAESLTWLRTHLKGDEPRPEPVRIFVTGLEEWRNLPAWPPATTALRWHLHPDGRLAPDLPAEGEPDRYVYDPADPTPNLGGALLDSGRSRVDNRRLEERPDVLTYTSAPLTADLEVMGEPTADLVVRSDRPHTDFFARLCDVEPAGKSTNICDGLLRLTPGNPEAELDGTMRVRIALRPTAHVFRRGHRLRLQVSSGAHPRYARNTGTGDPLGDATTLVAAHQEVHHASAIELPVT